MRECAACFACCITPEIAELEKPAGQRCVNLTPEGKCGIYETRPQVCRDFECGWRLDPKFRSDERPDLVGIMVMGLVLGKAKLNAAHELREGAFASWKGDRLLKRIAKKAIIGLADHGKPTTLTEMRLGGPARLIGALSAHTRQSLGKAR